MLLSEGFTSARARFDDVRSDLYDAAAAEVVSQVTSRHPGAVRVRFEVSDLGELASSEVVGPDGAVLEVLGPLAWVEDGSGRAVLGVDGEPLADCDPLSVVLDACWNALWETSGDPVEELELLPFT